jgi:hypothetical protein
LEDSVQEARAYLDYAVDTRDGTYAVHMIELAIAELEQGLIDAGLVATARKKRK